MALFDYTKRLMVGSVFFSLPESLTAIASELHQTLCCSDFSHRYLTTYENKILGIDDIAGTLNITLEQLMGVQAYCYDTSDSYGNHLRFYATEYFVLSVIETMSDDNDLQNPIGCVNNVAGVIATVLKGKSVNVLRNMVVLENHFITEKDAILDALSPIQMDEMDTPFLNRRYAETVSRGNFIIDIVRHIKYGRMKENPTEELYNIYFMARCYDSKVIKNGDFKSCFNEMFSTGIDFASKFFK